MASYKIVFKQSVAKDLRAIPDKDVKRILKRIDDLADNPCPPRSEKLTGDDKYRVRQGNYRILYAVEDEIITVTIERSGQDRRRKG